MIYIYIHTYVFVEVPEVRVQERTVHVPQVGDFTDTICPFFESDTLFLECSWFVVSLVAWRLFGSRDV